MTMDKCPHTETELLARDFTRDGVLCSVIHWCRNCGAWRDRVQGRTWYYPETIAERGKRAERRAKRRKD